MDKKLWIFRPIIYILMGLSLALTLVTAFLNPYVFIAEAAVTLAVFIALYIRIRKMQGDVQDFLEHISKLLASPRGKTLLSFPIPVIVADAKYEVIWYNSICKRDMLGGRDIFGLEIQKIIPKLDMDGDIRTKGIRLTYMGRSYRAYMIEAAEEETLYLFYLFDETELKKYAEEYFETRPSVATIIIDNYDELLQNAKESEKMKILASIDNILERFVIENNCIISKTGRRDKYIAIIEERYMKRLTEERFKILEEIRNLEVSDNKMSVTASMGIGRGGRTFGDNEKMANQALEMALGRGGDQVVIKNPDGFDFYGGISNGLEKQTKVKTRIMAAALSDLIANSENVIIMGHRLADMDCLGAAIGMCKIVASAGKQVNIALNSSKNLAGSLYEKAMKEGYEGIFVGPEEAPALVKEDTLIVIVDTHIPTLVECPNLLEMCKNVVVIDHHRKMVGYIDDALIFYHEPYASSASEMVTELAQYFGEETKFEKCEAEALLAGIMLDTKSFSVKAGVRTFEAAAYLRRSGADTIEVKKLFGGTISAYRRRAQLVAEADIYRNCAIAGAVGESDEIKLVAPQTADELLTLNSVDASFVMSKYEGETSISARSFGKINVQLVMEYMGGGGHQTMAGAQLKGVGLAEAKEALLKAIDEYYEKNKK